MDKRRWWLATCAFGAALCLPSAPQQQQYRFNATSEFVLVDVAARDQHHNFVRDLKADEITVLEDGKPQQIASFEFEDLGSKDLGGSDVAVETPAAPTAAPAAVSAAGGDRYENRRLVMLYFDSTALRPDDVGHAMEAAQAFVRNSMQPADLVSIAWYDGTLRRPIDFIADKDKLLATLATLPPAHRGRANPAQEMEAIEHLCDELRVIEQKKEVLLFSSGFQGSAYGYADQGADFALQLYNAKRAAIAANTVLNAWDARGKIDYDRVCGAGEDMDLVAIENGGCVNVDSLEISREALHVLTSYTGGDLLLDAKTPAGLLADIQAETATYYLISYRPTHAQEDGKFHKLDVKTKRPGVKLSFRKGFEDPADFAHSSKDDLKQQMLDQLDSDFPERDLPLRAQLSVARLADGGTGLSITLLVPGSQLGLPPGPKPVAIDFAGVVLDANGDNMGEMNGTVKVDPKQPPRWVQWHSDEATVSPGVYFFRFAVREDATGRLGTSRGRLVVRP